MSGYATKQHTLNHADLSIPPTAVTSNAPTKHCCLLRRIDLARWERRSLVELETVRGMMTLAMRAMYWACSIVSSVLKFRSSSWSVMSRRIASQSAYVDIDDVAGWGRGLNRYLGCGNAGGRGPCVLGAKGIGCSDMPVAPLQSLFGSGLAALSWARGRVATSAASLTAFAFAFAFAWC